MIEKIIILPRNIVESMATDQYLIPLIDKDWALISIYSMDILPDSCQNNLKLLNCKEIMSTQFEDITHDIPGENHILFNRWHAHQIISFIDKARDLVPILVIHCTAGISRSGATGLFACRYLGLDETKFRKENRPMPNMHVLKTLTDVSGINADYIKYWEKLALNRRFISLKERRIKF